MIWTLMLGAVGLWVLVLFLRKKTDLEKIPHAGYVFQMLPMSQNQIFEKFRENTELYGDRWLLTGFYRLVLNISSPKDIETVLSHPRNIDKGMIYQFLVPWLGRGLLISTGAKWLNRRKILTPTFHFNILKNFAVVIEEKSRDLATRLRGSVVAGECLDVNIMLLISDCTLYTICETAMGTKLDLEMSEKKTHYKKAILELGSIILDRVPRMWYHWEWLYQLLPAGRRYARCLHTVRSFANDVIIDKKNKKAAEEVTEQPKSEQGLGAKTRLALLDLLLEAETKGEIDLEGIREEVNTFMFEGHDTTAMALTFALMLIAEHHEVQERIYEEIQSVLGDSERVPNMADLTKMKYLEAALKETMRVYPSVPFISRFTTEDFQMGDIKVKAGTEIAVHLYDLHHRADLFPDPEAFRPERFLGAPQRHPYAFVPFSAGPRNCIGQRFAMQEMKCVVAELVRAFQLAPSPHCPRRPRLIADIVLRPLDPVYVRFQRR